MQIKKIRVKTAEPFVFLHGAKTVAYAKIPTAGQKIMDGLDRFMQGHKIEINGPAVWSYQGTRDGKLKLKAGLPVKKGTRGKAPFAAKLEPAWECLSAEFKGPMTRIVAAWEELFAAAEKKGLACENDRREIYRKWVAFDSEDNITELQIRINGKG